jgi:hypothetical protein
MKNKFKITKEDIIKLWKKANRELAQKGPRGGFHEKSIKDLEEKKKNTIRREDYE